MKAMSLPVLTLVGFKVSDLLPFPGDNGQIFPSSLHGML